MYNVSNANTDYWIKDFFPSLIYKIQVCFFERTIHLIQTIKLLFSDYQIEAMSSAFRIPTVAVELSTVLL